MPFDSTTVIPAGWSQHHASAARGGMNAEVTIGVPDGPAVHDAGTDDTSQNYTDDYSGPARIQALDTQGNATVVAGQELQGRSYLVQIDFTESAATQFATGARVKVTACANDLMLAGQDLWVLDIPMGSERFTRDLICSDNETDAPSS